MKKINIILPLLLSAILSIGYFSCQKTESNLSALPTPSDPISLAKEYFTTNVQTQKSKTVEANSFQANSNPLRLLKQVDWTNAITKNVDNQTIVIVPIKFNQDYTFRLSSVDRSII
jgi:hypothetical protein